MMLIDKDIYNNRVQDEYELNNMSFGRDSSHYGFMLGYLIATHKDIEIEYFSAEVEMDEGFEYEKKAPWDRSYTKEQLNQTFSSLDAFMQYQEQLPIEEWRLWHIEAYYKNSKIAFVGWAESSIVRVCYDSTSPVDITPLLEEIEKQTFLYHSFDSQLIERLITEYQITFETAVNLMALLRNCFNSKYQKLIDSFDKGILEFPASKEVTDRIYNLKFEDIEGLYDTLKETE